MSFLNGFFNFFGGGGTSQATSNSSSAIPSITRFFTSFFNPTNSGIKIEPEDSLQLSPVWLAVRAISEDIAKLPIKIVIKEDNEVSEIKDNPLGEILTKGFNPNVDSMTGIETLVRWLLMYGNAYCEIVTSTTGKMQWELIHPTRVDPIRQEDGSFKYRVIIVKNTSQTITRIFTAAQMLHLKGPGDGHLGFVLGNISAESMGIGIAAQNFTGSFFGNNLSIGAALETDKSLDAETKAAVRKEWKEKFGGSNKAYEMAILDRGFKFNRLQMNSTDAELLATRKFQVEEVSRWFRIPLHKLMDMSKSTFNNVEQSDINYATDTIAPWLARLEKQLTFRFLSGNKLVDIDEKFLSRGDTKARVLLYKELFAMGVIDANQIAFLEGFPVFEGGDKKYIPLNLAPQDLSVESLELDIEIKRKQLEEPENEPETTETETEETEDESETEETETEEEQPQENNSENISQDGAISAFIPVMRERLEVLVKKEKYSLEAANKKNTQTEKDEHKQRFYIRFETELQEFLIVQFSYLCKVADKRSQTKAECLKLAQEICGNKTEKNRADMILKKILNKVTLSETAPKIGDIQKCEDGKYYKWTLNGWRPINE